MSKGGAEQPAGFFCRCCGARTLHEADAWEICSVCAWEDDPSQASHPDLRGGANAPSLNEARRHWLATRTRVPRAWE